MQNSRPRKPFSPLAGKSESSLLLTPAYSKRLTLSLSSSTMEKLDEARAVAGVDRSAWVRAAILHMSGRESELAKAPCPVGSVKQFGLRLSYLEHRVLRRSLLKAMGVPLGSRARKVSRYVSSVINTVHSEVFGLEG